MGQLPQQQNHVACLIIYCNLWQQIEINTKKKKRPRKKRTEIKPFTAFAVAGL